MIERSDEVQIEGLRIINISKTKSCARGLVFNSSNNVKVRGEIRTCSSRGIDIENSDDNGSTLRNLTNIDLDIRLISPGQDGLVLTRSGSTLPAILSR